MFIDLDDPTARAKVVRWIHADVEQFCINEFDEDPRTHLGASIIGHDCKAFLWSVFRWLKHAQHCGQLLRLFNRGHEEERRFARWLRGAGFEVSEFDAETKEQYRIVGVDGHFGGSLDSKLIPPAKYNLPNIIWLGEFKTHNESSFSKLAGKKVTSGQIREGGKGVQLSKRMHFKQMCSYGRAYDFKYGLYCAVNKNTDELYFEIVVLDFAQAGDMFVRAREIITSQTRPQKIAQTIKFTDCKECNFNDLCFGNTVPDKNCRSCEAASPAPDAEWFCATYNAIIPKHAIPLGCSNWRRIV